MSWAEEKTLEKFINGTLDGYFNRQRIFTEDAVFTLPGGFTKIKISACGSGKGIYAGQAILREERTVKAGETITITVGMDDSLGYKDTVIESESLGRIILYAGTVASSTNSDILGIDLGYTGGSGGSGGYGAQNLSAGGSGGSGGYGGLFGIGGGGGGGGGGAGYYMEGPSRLMYHGGGGGGASGGRTTGGTGGAGTTSNGTAVPGSGGSLPEPYAVYDNRGTGGTAGNSTTGGAGGRAGNGGFYGAGGGAGGSAGSVTSNMGYPGSAGAGGAAGKPSGGMVFIEW